MRGVLVPPANALRRQWPTTSPRSRSEAQRDRDRILYSTAFKRLAHVTQVSAPETGLTFHSRLTHSLKVAQFARRLAEKMQERPASGPARKVASAIDPDAAEAAALAHDLGHPPFGHLAEVELNKLARRFGGFEGNAQSFRIVTQLALRSEEHPGLNLTRKTLNGILKYPWLRADQDADGKWNVYDADAAAFDWARLGRERRHERTIEAEIMDWADDVTYAVHDMDDFYRAGFVPLERLRTSGVELEAFQGYLAQKYPEDRHPGRAKSLGAVAERLFRNVLFGFKAPYSGTEVQRIDLRGTGSLLITRYIDAPRLEVDDGRAMFVVDENFRNEVAVLKQLIWFYVIDRPSLGILQKGHTRVIRELYKIYEDAAINGEWRLFPSLYVARLRAASDDNSKRRTVVDLISSMTESSAIEVYRRMTGVVGASISDPTGRIA
jgi:dGTPase